MQRVVDGTSLVTPALIDVTGLEIPDEEHFGPLLKVHRYRDWDEAIDLANGQILADYLSKGAKALGAEKKPARERIDWLFRHALARKPSDAESAVLAEVAKEDAGSREMEDLLWMVFMHPEFQIIR